MGSFIVGTPILISGARQIWGSRCRSRPELPYYSIRHAWQWWFENNVQNQSWLQPSGHSSILFMALWYYGWEFTQTDPTFPSYVLSSVHWIHPSLSRFIPENKLLASVPCFQKMHLLFMNDSYFLTTTCRSLRFFCLFTFCFIFSLKLYTCGPLWGKLFFVHLHSYIW